jgi:hypothetical protein
MSDRGTVACGRGSVRAEFGFSSRAALESDLTDGCFARGGWVVGRAGQLSVDGGRFAENGCLKVSLGGSRVGIPAESRRSWLARGLIWGQGAAQRRDGQNRTRIRRCRFWGCGRLAVRDSVVEGGSFG